MDYMDLATAMGALALVLGLIAGLGWVLQRTGIIHGIDTNTRPSRNNRLKVVDNIPLDPRRRLLIVRRDNHEHLIILGQNGEREIGDGWQSISAPDSDPNTPSQGPEK